MISVDVPVPVPLDGVPTETVVALGVPLTVPDVVTPPGPEVVTPPGPEVLRVADVTVGVPLVTIVVAVAGM